MQKPPSMAAFHLSKNEMEAKYQVYLGWPESQQREEKQHGQASSNMQSQCGF